LTIKYFGDGKLKKRALIASILAATLIVGGPSLASAEQVKLTETIEEINQEILLGADLDELTISSDSARTNLSLTLLGADSGAVWEQEGSNQNLAFDNFSLNATSTEPGSAQVLITIAEEASPEDYSFELSLNGQPALAEVLVDGSVIVTDSNGQFGAYLPAPWARDARGRGIPTHYVVEGNVLTQVVEHRSNGYEYPLTADPWLGIDLIDRIERAYLAPSAYRVKVHVTPWVGTLYAVPYGNAYSIMTSAGWSEVLTKLQSTFSLQMRTYISERPQYRDQFDCHAFGAPLGFLLQGVDKSPSWDLEGTRSPNRDVLDWVSSKCNW
jgi:hypothetical protein